MLDFEEDYTYEEDWFDDYYDYGVPDSLLTNFQCDQRKTYEMALALFSESYPSVAEQMWIEDTAFMLGDRVLTGYNSLHIGERCCGTPSGGLTEFWDIYESLEEVSA